MPSVLHQTTIKHNVLMFFMLCSLTFPLQTISVIMFVPEAGIVPPLNSARLVLVTVSSVKLSGSWCTQRFIYWVLKLAFRIVIYALCLENK